jgi:hypothetical protein
LPLGEASLYFCGTLASLGDEALAVSRIPEHAVALERRCLADDVSEVELSSVEHTYVLINDREAPTPLAGAGFDRGRALQAAAVAVEGAMASGLIPQWRARTDNIASHRTALSAGFVYVLGRNSETSLLLGLEITGGVLRTA